MLATTVIRNEAVAILMLAASACLWQLSRSHSDRRPAAPKRTAICGERRQAPAGLVALPQSQRGPTRFLPRSNKILVA
jgi:hypothetical protein